MVWRRFGPLREALDNPGVDPRLASKSLAASRMPRVLAEVFQSFLSSRFCNLPPSPVPPTKEDPQRDPATESVQMTYDPKESIDWRNPKCTVARHFSVQEVTQSYARRIPDAGSKIEANILRLASELDDVREAWGSPIGVTS
jgi:hypothetical protein